MTIPNFRKALPAIGLTLISSNLIIGHYASASDFVDFIRGMLVGIGIVFVIFPFIKRRPKPAC